MDINVESTDRGPADYTLFALGFFGFLLGAAGIILVSAAAAFMGAVIVLLVIVSFALRRSPDEE